MSREYDLERARRAAEACDLDTAYAIADGYLTIDPHDTAFLHVMVYSMLGSYKRPIAYHLARRAAEEAPDQPGAWLNLGMASADLWQTKEAERHYKKALTCNPSDKQRSMILVNLASVLIDTGRYAESEALCREAAILNPDSKKAPANLGFAQLAQRNWKEGWANYRNCIGSEWRPEIKYNDEPLWDGKGRGTIAIYAEQGIGDVISFGSMLPDMVKWCAENDSRLIFEVDKKLEGVYRRTFPGITVYGSRGEKGVAWRPEDQAVDYSLPLGQLGEYFRTEDKDFTDGVYLNPCPDRVKQWKALFGNKPTIGIAWRGGIHRTGAKYRQFELEQMLPIFESVDARWVSLQYRDAGKEVEDFAKKHGIDIVQYEWGTLTDDYDDTIALIASLDRVICMQTAVAHTAGALGIPCDVFVQAHSQWRYGQGHTDLPWADSVTIHRQKDLGDWESTIKEYAENADLAKLQKATGRITGNNVELGPSSNQKECPDVGEVRKLAIKDRRAKKQNGTRAVLGKG